MTHVDPRDMGASSKTTLDPTFIQRVVQGVRYAFTGSRGGDWFGPNQPVQPNAPADVKGRAFDFQQGVNLQQRPRALEPISFETLRSLSSGYDILRLAIETRKDQLSKLTFQIQPKLKPGQVKRPPSDERCDEVQSFLRRPDPEQRHDWHTWLRILIEDLLVIDAPAIYVRRNLEGGIFGLQLVDGATIKRVLSADGRTPQPPEAAYQQVLKGVIAGNLTTEELIYQPRNPRSDKMYGFSPVEQIVMTVNIALRRTIFQLQYFTEGNIPEALIGVPESWNAEEIRKFQSHWDGLFEGNTAMRRHAKFVPGDLKVQYTKEGVLTDQFDEWLARIVCYAFSLPPLPFVKQMNRATAQNAYEASLEEGLEPLMVWIKNLMDDIVQEHFGYPDLEFVWDDRKKPAPAEMASINTSYMRQGVLSLDEVRQELGKEPLGMGHAIWGIGPMGITFVSDLIDPVKRQEMMGGAAGGLAPPGMPPGAGGGGALPPGAGGIPGSQRMLPPPAGRDPLVGLPAGLLEAVGVPGVAPVGGGLPEDSPVEDETNPSAMRTNPLVRRELTAASGFQKADALGYDTYEERVDLFADRIFKNVMQRIERRERLAKREAREDAPIAQPEPVRLEKAAPAEPTVINVHVDASGGRSADRKIELTRDDEGRLVGAIMSEDHNGQGA